MSRSIGDGMAKTLGVIAEPEIFILNNNQKLSKVVGLVQASDGIWDGLSNREVA